MMRTEHYTCDHCGKELDGGINDYINCEIDMEVCRVDADLCSECAEKLKGIVEAFLNRGEK